MRILKNTTNSDIFIADTGVTLLANSSLTLSATEYSLWAASSDVITYIGSGSVVVNNGTEDLDKANSVSLLQSNKKDTDFVSSLKSSDRLRVSVFHENSGGSSYTVVTTSTSQATTSTTPSDVTQLTTPSLSSGLYRVHVTGLFQSASATNGAGFRLASGTATISLYVVDWEVQQGNNGTDQDYEYKQLDSTINTTSSSVATANVNYRFNGFGLIRITSPGTVKVQFRSELSGTATTVQVDSTLIMEKLT